MPASKPWSKFVDPTLRARLEASAQVVFDNASGLLSDAEVLFDAKRFPRALALAVLAEEEFGKAFMLRNCADQGRWDSEVVASLRSHGAKQALAQVMKAWSDWYVDNYRKVEALNRRALIPSQPGVMPGRKQWEELIAAGQRTIKKPVRDYLKQDSLYVSIDSDAKVSGVPQAVGADEASAAIGTAKAFASFVSVTLRHDGAMKAWLGSHSPIL